MVLASWIIHTNFQIKPKVKVEKVKPEPKVKPKKKSIFLSIGTTDEVQTIEPNIEANTDSDGLLASIEKTFGKIPKFNMFGKKQDT